MIKMILVLDEQEKITLKRCLSLFIGQAKEKLIVADQVEIQTALQIWDSVVEVETTGIEEVVKKSKQIIRELTNENHGTGNPHEPKTTFERDEPA